MGEELAKKIGIIIETCIKVYTFFPKWIFTFLVFLSVVISTLSGTFNYTKPELTAFIDSINWYIFMLGIFISLIASLGIGFYRYISESEDRLEFIKEQYNEQPLFMNNQVIQDIIHEIDNFLYLKDSTNLIKAYLPVLEFDFAGKNRIEVIARNNRIQINRKMIFELWKKKQVSGTEVYDSFGLVSVLNNSVESFKSILIDTQPENLYWQDISRNLKKNKKMTCNDFYLKIYIPTKILDANKESLKNMREILKKL